MAKNWWDDDNGEELSFSTPASGAKAAPQAPSKDWWDDGKGDELTFGTPASEGDTLTFTDDRAKSRPKNIPRIGGFVPKEEEKYTNPRYLLGAALGGGFSRNIPVLSELIPMTETEHNRSQYLEENHPYLKKAADVASGVAATAPLAGVGAGATLTGQGLSGLLRYMGTQAGLNAGIGAADQYAKDPNTTAEEYKMSALRNGIGGALGPAIGKAITPIGSVPASFKPGQSIPGAYAAHGQKIDNVGDMIGKGIRGVSVFTPGAHAAETAYSMFKDVAPAQIYKNMGKAYARNDIMSPGRQMIMNSGIQAGTRSLTPQLTDEQRRQLEALGGQ